MGTRTDGGPGACGRARRSRSLWGLRQYPVLAVALAGALLLGACTSSAVGTSTDSSVALPSGSSGAPGDFGGGAKAAGTDVGLTATEIRIGVIADVQTSVAPGLFQKSVNAVKAWADFVNAAGGLAGRKVVVDFIDSKHDANAARDAVIQACSKDFALVGTEALNLSTVNDIDDCKDAHGKAIGVPNLAGIALGLQQCDEDTFTASQNDQVYCRTQHDGTPSHTEQIGDTKWLLSQNSDLHGIFIYNTDVPAIQVTQIAQFDAAVGHGIKKDGTGYHGAALSDPQSAQTPIVQMIKRYGATYVSDAVGPGNLVLLRREAQLQGVSSVKVWICGANCYSHDFLTQGGSAVEGVYNTLPTLPFVTEYQSNPALNALVQKVGGVEKIDANAVSAYNAALLFQDAVRKAAASGTLNRQTLFDVLRNDETAFDAQGILGQTNVSKHQASPCFVIAQVKDGKWERAYPAKAGSFDCNPSNLVASR